MFSILVSTAMMEHPHRRLPFVPVYLSKNSYIGNYFDFNHLKLPKNELNVYKSVVENLKTYQDATQYIRKLNILAKDKKTTACFILGTIFEYGLTGVEMNDTLAYKYYELGARYDDKECMYRQSYFLRYGIGTEVNIPKSISLTTSAAKKQCVSAIMALGFYSRYGIDTVSSKEKSFSNYRKIVKALMNNITQNMIDDLRQSKVRMLDPFVLPENNEKRERSNEIFLGHLSDNENSHATYQLAVKNIYSRDPNYIEAHNLLVKSAKTGIGYGMLGLLTAAGLGCKKNETRAMELFKTGVEKGDYIAFTFLFEKRLKRLDYQLTTESIKLVLFNPRAEFAFANYLLNEGKEKDQALKSIKSVAKKDYAPAQYQYAIYLMEGMYGYQNTDKSLTWMIKAAESTYMFDDNIDAWNSYVHGDSDYALKIYMNLANLGSTNALWNIFVIGNFNGYDVESWIRLQKYVGITDDMKRFGYVIRQTDNGNKFKFYSISAELYRELWANINNPSNFESSKILLLRMRPSASPLIAITQPLAIIANTLKAIYDKNARKFIRVFYRNNWKVLLFVPLFIVMSVFLYLKIKLITKINEEQLAIEDEEFEE